MADGAKIVRHVFGDNEDQVVHTYQVLLTLGDIRAALNVAESSQRGYLITVDPNYLRPYQDSLPEILRHLKKLQELTKESESQVRNLPELEKRIYELEKIIKQLMEEKVNSL